MKEKDMEEEVSYWPPVTLYISIFNDIKRFLKIFKYHVQPILILSSMNMNHHLLFRAGSAPNAVPDVMIDPAIAAVAVAPTIGAKYTAATIPTTTPAAVLIAPVTLSP